MRVLPLNASSERGAVFFVRMKLQGQLLVCTFYIIIRAVLRHTKHLVVVLFTENGTNELLLVGSRAIWFALCCCCTERKESASMPYQTGDVSYSAAQLPQSAIP